MKIKNLTKSLILILLVIIPIFYCYGISTLGVGIPIGIEWFRPFRDDHSTSLGKVGKYAAIRIFLMSIYKNDYNSLKWITTNENFPELLRYDHSCTRSGKPLLYENDFLLFYENVEINNEGVVINNTAIPN